MIGIPKKRKPHVTRYARAAKDPDYGIAEAVSEYMAAHPRAAVEVGLRYMRSVDPEGAPMSWDEFDRYVDTLGPRDAFEAGSRSDGIDRSDRYVASNGDGGFYTMSESDLEDQCIALGSDEGFVASVINGRTKIPKQMADVLAVFVPKKSLAIDRNVKGRLIREGKKVVGGVARRVKELRERRAGDEDYEE